MAEIQDRFDEFRDCIKYDIAGYMKNLSAKLDKEINIYGSYNSINDEHWGEIASGEDHFLCPGDVVKIRSYSGSADVVHLVEPDREETKDIDEYIGSCDLRILISIVNSLAREEEFREHHIK